jgi:uncharacterized protein YbaP (TraB family)
VFNRIVLSILLALMAACSRPVEVRPALWLVEGPSGQKAWLFGTIHALPDPVDWRSPVIDGALKQSDRLILEVAGIADDATTAEIFSKLAQGGPHPPLDKRVTPDLADDLASEMQRDGMRRGELDKYDTWAAAVLIARAQSQIDGQDSSNGIDRALAQGYHGPIGELEGAASQLGIFDALPEAQQRAMLGAVLHDSLGRRNAARQLEAAWARGDLETIERSLDSEFLNDPALRDALLVRRNRNWTDKLVAMLKMGAHPFVAVGAGHMVGSDGLPAMLTARGFKVTRLQ